MSRSEWIRLRFTGGYGNRRPWMILWFLGLFLALFAAMSFPFSSEVLVDSVVCGRELLFGRFLILSFPLLLSAFAVICFGSNALAFIIPLKSFFFGYCFFGIAFVFGQAGWLAACLLLLPQLLFLPMLLWFWQRVLLPDCNLPLHLLLGIAYGTVLSLLDSIYRTQFLSRVFGF